MSESTTTTCAWCDEEKECLFIPDPFVSEVYPQDEPQPNWICEECANARRDDI